MNIILRYLSELEVNNNKEWYNANKKLYQEANAEFEALIERLIFSIGQTDGSIIVCNMGLKPSPSRRNL